MRKINDDGHDNDGGISFDRPTDRLYDDGRRTILFFVFSSLLFPVLGILHTYDMR